MAIDEALLEAFIARFRADLGAARHRSTVVLGNTLGLYRALADLGPTDAAALAAATARDPREVQDWLRDQHLAGYCHHSEATERYWLSPEQAAVLADPRSPAFLVGALTTTTSLEQAAAVAARHPIPSTTNETQPKEHPMPGVEVNDFATPDEVRRPERTTVELVKIGDGEVGRYTFQPGWRWSECIKPVVGTESCQVEHVGYVVSGSMHIEHADGAGDINAGEVYRIPPGHDAHVVGDEPVVVVEFQGAATYARG